MHTSLVCIILLKYITKIERGEKIFVLHLFNQYPLYLTLILVCTNQFRYKSCRPFNSARAGAFVRLIFFLLQLGYYLATLQ